MEGSGSKALELESDRPQNPPPITPDCLRGGGRVGEVMRSLDWSTSPLGDPESWLPSLRTMVRFILTTGQPACLYWGPQRVFLYNDAASALLGPERHPHALGRPGAEAWPEIWPEFSPQIDEVMRSGAGLTLRESRREIVRDGVRQETWWNATLSPIDDPSAPGSAGGVVVLATEVTAQRSSREITAAERARLLSVFDNSASFLAVAEGPEHRFVLTNKSYLALIGRQNVVGLTVKEALPEVVEQGLLEALDRVYETGEPFVARNRSLMFNPEGGGPPHLRRLDFIYHRLSDETGERIGILAEGHDVTEIVERKEALQEANQTLKAILDHSPDLICALGETGRINLISSSCSHILGYAADELLGGDLFDLVHADDRRQASAVLEQATTQATVQKQQFRLTHRNGAAVTMRWSAVQSPELKTIYAVGRDVTEELQKERELRHAQKMEALGRITAGIAHDFNNLLTVSTIAAEALLASPSQDDEQKTQAGLVLGAAERGTELIKRLLAFSRRQSLSPETVDIGVLLSGMTRLIEAGLGSAVRVTLDVDAEAHLTCQIDFAQLEAAVFNLCLNARDAMPQGGAITISVRETKLGVREAEALRLAPGDYVTIAVVDTGHGMSADILERAVEPFFTTKGDRDGSGLGLSMVYGFARQSGGQVAIVSRPGDGTSVSLHLPCTAGSAAPAAAPAPALAPAAPQGSAHILVVEDDDTVRTSVVSYLKGLGYTISEAADGAAAAQLIGRDASIDLLFTDVEMPSGMNGRQLADRSRLLRPDLRVLFTSGYTEDQIISQGRLRQAGWPFIQKPYRRAHLAVAIADALSHRPTTAWSSGE